MSLEWLIEMWKEEAAERKAKGLDWRSGEKKNNEDIQDKDERSND